MAFIERFSDEEKDLLASLPYRAGLWISNCDSGGGAESDYEELSNLEDVIENEARAADSSMFAQEIMKATLARQSSWKQWAEKQSLDAVPDDCIRAVVLIGRQLSAKEIDEYRAVIMKTATGVAKAFREGNMEDDFWVWLIGMVKAGIEDVMYRLTGKAPQKMMNISEEERKALEALEAVLTAPS